MLKNIRSDNRGFTLIELLMVILVIGVLAAIGITQFVNFGKDAKDSAIKANLQVLRNGIAAQNGMIRIRCSYVGSAYPLTAAIVANDIRLPTYVAGDATTSPCDTTLVTISDPDSKFVANGIPVNPWGSTDTTLNNVVHECATTGCTSKTDKCDGSGAKNGTSTAGNEDGWCYNPATGEIWANTAANNGAAAGSGNEYTF